MSEQPIGWLGHLHRGVDELRPPNDAPDVDGAVANLREAIVLLESKVVLNRHDTRMRDLLRGTLHRLGALEGEGTDG